VFSFSPIFYILTFMYWFFPCNNYHPDAIKALVYSAYKFNPEFKPICIWDEPKIYAPILREWLEDKGVIVHQYRSSLALQIILLQRKSKFNYAAFNCEEFGIPENKEVSLYGMWSKTDVPLICEELEIEDNFVLVTDPDCMFVAEYDLKLEPDILAVGPEEEPYREWASGGIYVFNVKRMLEDRKSFEEFVIENYRNIGWHETLSLTEFYGFKNVNHISPDWNYKPFWEKERDYLISPTDRAIFRSTPKLIHFQGTYKPWVNPPQPDNTDMKLYCDIWHDYLNLSDSDFKFKS
jgi:hypothetical protein